MRTVEEVERLLGAKRSQNDVPPSGGSCSYNPNLDGDPSGDCNQIPRWHIRCRGEKADQAYSMTSCDVHLSRLIGSGPYSEAVMDWHEFGSACGLEGSWWMVMSGDVGSFCVTVERGVELGLLAYVDND